MWLWLEINERVFVTNPYFERLRLGCKKLIIPTAAMSEAIAVLIKTKYWNDNRVIFLRRERRIFHIFNHIKMNLRQFFRQGSNIDFVPFCQWLV